MQAKDGFAGSVMVVTDADWRAKWDTPSNTVPNINAAQSDVNVRCDLDLDRPDGSSALHQADPTGDWTVRVTLRDAARKSSLSLKTSFHVH